MVRELHPFPDEPKNRKSMGNMFCYQCQETAFGTGCTIRGVCGKHPDTAALMDLLIYAVQGISAIHHVLHHRGLTFAKADRFVTEALFATITNTNFDPDALTSLLERAFTLKKELSETARRHNIQVPAYRQVLLEVSPENFIEAAATTGILQESDEDIRALKQLAIYGMKGAAAYACHALRLGMEDPEVYDTMQTVLSETCRTEIQAPDLVDLIAITGECGVRAMALLDKANTSAYGDPTITRVNIGTRTNPGILVSGHDLCDLEELLRQSEGTGVDIYTHGEMLPAHYYPNLRRFSHLAGNYGNAWWKQNREFESFNGPVLLSSNCLVPPLLRAAYKDRIYTTGPARYPGFPHIPDGTDGNPKDFSVLIEHAKRCPPPIPIERGSVTGGFAHNQLAELSDRIVEALHSGRIRRFVVMAGCDGRMPSREYYTEFALQLPEDTVILTAGCAKYRYLKLPLGEIDGLPRVWDAGQCNDSYSLAILALRLKERLGAEYLNDLPIVYNIAWYEQKAVIVLLALFSLGIKNIHLGPTMPTFFSTNVCRVLREVFGLNTISTPERDIEKWLTDTPHAEREVHIPVK